MVRVEGHGKKEGRSIQQDEGTLLAERVWERALLESWLPALDGREDVLLRLAASSPSNFLSTGPTVVS